MFEIEVKVRIERFEKIKHSLKELGAILTKKEHQRDNYFLSSIRNFEQTGEVLRVREQIPGNGLITYKGPRLESEMKVRKEIEVRVQNSLDAIELLHELGFNLFFTFEKEREMYQLNEFSVSLDKVRDLGNFLEIELKAEDTQPILQQKIFDLLHKIGVSRDSIEKRSYLELILDREKKNAEKQTGHEDMDNSMRTSSQS